jgi:hypothetical protein
MQNLTVHLGSATPLSSWAGPPAPALSTAPANIPAPPVSGTAARQCVAPHLSAPSLPALSGRHARAQCTSPASAALEPLSGAVRQSGLGPMALPRHVAPPRLGPPLSPLLFPLCRRAAHSPLALLDSSTGPHSSPTPPLERLSIPTTPCTRTAASDHRQPPLARRFRPSTAAVRHFPVSSSPSYQYPRFLANPSLPRLS